MRFDQIVRAEEGTQRHIQEVNEVQIQDLWHTAMVIQAHAEGRAEPRLTATDAEMVLEVWALAHDLLTHIKRVCVEPKTE